MTEVHRKVMSMGEEYVILLDSLIDQVKDLVTLSKEMELYMDSQEYMTTIQPEEELDKQIELAKIMATQFIELHNLLEQLK